MSSSSSSKELSGAHLFLVDGADFSRKSDVEPMFGTKVAALAALAAKKTCRERSVDSGKAHVDA